MDKMILDMSVLGHGGGILVVGAASVSATLAAGTELIAISTSANAHIRFTSGAGTAVGTDPMVHTNAGVVVFKLPANIVWTLSVIQDGASAGNLSYFRVYEA